MEIDYNNFDFGTAPADQGDTSELLPDGLLAWAIITVRPHNLDHGLVLVPSKSSEGKFLDVEFTILEGPYAKRKVWDRIGLAGSEKWVARGMSSVRHILEVGREMGTFQPGDQKYKLGPASGTNGEMIFMELNELRCAIRIGVEEGKDGFKDKNTVRSYLSPNPASDTHKNFLKLVAGDVMPTPKTSRATSVKPAASQQPAWAAQGAAPQTAAKPTPSAQPAGRPSWAGGAAAGDKAPF